MAGEEVCQGHQREATLFCTKCHAFYCYECAEHAWDGGRVAAQCPACKSKLQPLRHGHAARSGFLAFLAQLPLVLIYPLRRSVLGALLVVSVLSLLLWLFLPPSLPSRITATLVAGGLMWAIYFHMVAVTACGEEGLPWRGLGGVLSAIVLPLLWTTAAHLPAIAGAVWLTIVTSGAWFDRETGTIALAVLQAHPAPAALFLAGVLLLPLLMALAALTRSFFSILDPRNWWRVLRIMGLTYLVAALLFHALQIAESFVYEPYLQAHLPGLFQKYLPPGYIDPAVAARLALYLLGSLPVAMQARLLGAMCRPHLDELCGPVSP